jgi:hypothetical protein
MFKHSVAAAMVMLSAGCPQTVSYTGRAQDCVVDDEPTASPGDVRVTFTAWVRLSATLTVGEGKGEGEGEGEGEAT